jgi:hypothetical protein
MLALGKGLSKKCPWVRFGRSVPTPRASQPARPPTLQGSLRDHPFNTLSLNVVSLRRFLPNVSRRKRKRFKRLP